MVKRIGWMLLKLAIFVAITFGISRLFGISFELAALAFVGIFLRVEITGVNEALERSEARILNLEQAVARIQLMPTFQLESREDDRIVEQIRRGTIDPGQRG